MWIDDIINGTDNIENARKVNQQINFLLKQIGLSLYKDKSVCLIMGSKKQKLFHSKVLETNPLICGHLETEERQIYKWQTNDKHCSQQD